MKLLLLFPTFMLCLFMCFSGYSQYKIDEQRFYSSEDNGSELDHELTMQYTYGNEGDKETSLLTLAMPGSTNITRVNKEYNANNAIINSVTQFWDESKKIWQDISRIVYEYDGANNLRMETYQSNNFGTMPFSNSFRITYSYSGSNISSEISQNWNSATSTWENNERDLFEYSGADITLHTDQEWEGGKWVNEEQTEIAYQAAGRPSQTIIKVWNSGTNSWDFDERITYTYASNLMREALGEDFVGGAWVLDHRTELSYENGLPKVVLYQERKSDAWENEDRYLYTHDGNGNNTILTGEVWDSVNLAWEAESRIETDYSLVLPFVLSSESFDIESFKVYPNPASDVLNISTRDNIKNVEIFDVLGKSVKRVLHSKSIDVSNLKTGVYFVKVLTDNGQETKKLAIE
ncbi:T9SS type A sorting domain-containing protein [Gelidibacter gilvus]|nr:T9SS type A sorting domain-containing protein [Gelidibacter gilvus]